MWLLGGLFGAGGMTLVTWWLATASASNLPRMPASAVVYGLTGLACLVGFLAGSAIWRRASRDRGHLSVFSGLAGGVAGGVVGATYAVFLTAAYLWNYSVWPEDRLDQVLVLLAYPAFGSTGFVLGAVIGIAAGAIVGGVLRLFPGAH